jgi:hypothetical protein
VNIHICRAFTSPIYTLAAGFPDNLVPVGKLAYDPTTNLNWGFDESTTLPLVVDKVRSSYASSKRPATVQELVNLFTTHLQNKTSIDEFLGTVTTGSATVSTKVSGVAYDPDLQAFRVVAIVPETTEVQVGEPLDPAAPLPGVGVWATQWYCNTSTSSGASLAIAWELYNADFANVVVLFLRIAIWQHEQTAGLTRFLHPRCTGVNVLDTYPNGTVTDMTADSCLCYSGYTGPSCSTPVQSASANETNSTVTNSTTSACPDSIPSPNEIRDGRHVVRAWVNETTGEAIVQVTAPFVVTRRYLQFSWGNCQSSSNPGGTVRGLDTISTLDTCYDIYQARLRLSGLAADCLLERFVNEAGNDSYVGYRGDFTLVYQEYVAIAPNLTLTRLSSVITPLDLLVSSATSADLDTPRIAVYSPYELSAAVTGTLVKTDATTSLVALTLAINAPYIIVNIMAQPSSAPIGDVPPLAQVWWQARFLRLAYSDSLPSLSVLGRHW